MREYRGFLDLRNMKKSQTPPVNTKLKTIQLERSLADASKEGDVPTEHSHTRPKDTGLSTRASYRVVPDRFHV